MLGKVCIIRTVGGSILIIIPIRVFSSILFFFLMNKLIHSNGSAGGPDGLRPQHLKDMISASANSGGEALIEALSSFISLILSGQTPIAIRPYFFGASLIALEKKGGGIRPIAVGCTLRRLAAKVASDKVMFEMASLLSPRQLGYGVSKGAEAAVHAARFYFKNIGSNKVFLKLDFRNAFNSIRRDRMLEAVHHLAPSIYSFVHSVYSSSSLFWSDKIILSSEGVQQGDPLGPLLFCLTIHHMCSRLKSELCIFYLDDGTLGGLLSDVLHDVEMIKKEAGIVGLELNPQKSEVVGNNSELIAGISLCYLGYVWLIQLLLHYWVHQLEALSPLKLPLILRLPC